MTRTRTTPAGVPAATVRAANARLRTPSTTGNFGDPTNRFGELCGHFDALDLSMPATLADELAELADLAGRLDTLTNTEPAFTLDDLRADDHAERFTRSTLAGLVATHGAKYAAQVLAVLDGTRRQAIRRHAPELLAILGDLYADRAADFWQADDPTITGAERDRRQHLETHLGRAVATCWNLTGPAELRYPSAEVHQWFHFTPQAWDRYIDEGMPGAQPRGNVYRFATHCGAQPRLVASRRDADAEAAGHHDRRRGY